MASQNIMDIFADCIERIEAGQTIEACLLVYPEHAEQLRSLLETSQLVHASRVSEPEILEDQAFVWEQIQAQLPQRRKRPFALFISCLPAAIIALLLLTLLTWVVLTRPNLPTEENLVPTLTQDTSTPITTDETSSPQASPTETDTVTSSPTTTSTVSTTMTLTATASTSPTLTFTPTITNAATATASASSTASETATLTPTTTNSPTASMNPTITATPTSTFVPGCGAAYTIEDAIERVLEIYPSTSIVGVTQVTKFDGISVWEVQTSHGIEVNIDVGCGYILTIERNTVEADNDNSNDNSNSDDNSITNGNSNDDSTTNGNSNSNDNDNDSDNSGMGGGDDD